MRRLLLTLFASLLFLQSCSLMATPTPPPTSKPTFTPTRTIIPTGTSTLTITPSPTIIKIPTVDYNLTPTPPGYVYISPTAFPWIPTMTPISTSTPTTPGEGFEWVRTSDYIFYWGSCRSDRVKISAQVSRPEDVYSVTLFVRVRRLTAQIYSEWTQGIGLEPVGAEGVWAQDLYGNYIPNHKLWRRGWVWYQLVAVGENNLEVGRTRIFADMLKLEPCMCLTPPCGPGD